MSYDFDPLARLSSRTIATTTPYTTTTTYLDGADTNSTTTLLASLTNGSNPAYSYTYDTNGNILTISEGATLKASYTYDMMNQLIREDSAYASKSIDYTYDVGGNLTSKTIYTFTGGVRGALEDTIVYGYTNAWKDKLTSYDGQSLTYDAIGNPLSYRNGLSFTWANGRELATITNNGVTGTFTYNDAGIRTSKTYNEVTTSYLLNGSSIVRQTQGESTLDFFYDENGNLYGFQKGTSTYYYLRNGQNDIVGILDSSGTQVVSYTYDAWGNQQPISGSLSTTIGEENPFRYRGYYFDTETGLYYLNSRYYDSVTGRFINADGLISASSTLLGTNMYAYCENNPINRKDETGEIWNFVIGGLMGALAGAVTSAAVQLMTSGKIEVGEVLHAAVIGGVSGVLAASGLPVIGQQIGNALINMADNAISQINRNKGIDRFDFGSLAFDGIMGWFAGKAGGDGFEVNVNIKKLGKNLTKKLLTFDYNKIKAGAIYYWKSTSTFYKRSLAVPIINSAKITYYFELLEGKMVTVK